MKALYIGIDSKQVAINLTEVGAVMEREADETVLVTGSDIYKVRAPFKEVFDDWKRA